MNLYLAFGSVQMSAVVTLKSMSKICHFASACLVSLSQWEVWCSVCWSCLSEGPVSLPPWSQSQWWRDGLVRRCGVRLYLLTASLMMLSTGTLGSVSISVPSRGTPAGNSSKIWVLALLFQCPKGSWVPAMCTWAQEIPINESASQARQILCINLGYTSQVCKPCTCLDLRPKKDTRVNDINTKGK